MMLRTLCYCLLVCLLATGCRKSYHAFASNYTYRSPGGQPDYAVLDNWAAHPYKHDPSDSVPRPLRAGYHPDSTVDVFFIHPTTYTDKEKPFGWNGPVDDGELNAKTDYTTILFQASIFNEAGRVFSPRYRQANLAAYYPITHDDTAHARQAFEEAYQDVKAAFNYYMSRLNKGHPIIIAAHSQGTTHAKRLLKEFFDGGPLQGKLVAAYLVGMVLEPDYFTTLTPCQTPLQTGCYTGWRTFKNGYVPPFIQKEKFQSVVTNPLSWDAAIPYVGRELNQGGVLLNFNKLVPGVADAGVHKGLLWSIKPRFFGNLFLKSKNYHVADMNLYYTSIRQNAAQRAEAYKHK